MFIKLCIVCCLRVWGVIYHAHSIINFWIFDQLLGKNYPPSASMYPLTISCSTPVIKIWVSYESPWKQSDGTMEVCGKQDFWAMQQSIQDKITMSLITSGDRRTRRQTWLQIGVHPQQKSSFCSHCRHLGVNVN